MSRVAYRAADNAEPRILFEARNCSVECTGADDQRVRIALEDHWEGVAPSEVDERRLNRVEWRDTGPRRDQWAHEINARKLLTNRAVLVLAREVIGDDDLDVIALIAAERRDQVAQTAPFARRDANHEAGAVGRARVRDDHPGGPTRHRELCGTRLHY